MTQKERAEQDAMAAELKRVMELLFIAEARIRDLSQLNTRYLRMVEVLVMGVVE